jgi:cellulose biosynthesis protein BcsQ
MAYAELNLTMQWLLRLGKRDTRFLLRKALHQKRVTNRFDIVLLDCPPLFNTCCVNALAASDYLLIPVLPSRKAAERVPLLLERLQRVLELYDKAIDPHVTLNQIEAAIKSLEQNDPTKARLEELARSVGFSQKFKSNAECIKAIRQKILGRKGAFERPNA